MSRKWYWDMRWGAEATLIQIRSWKRSDINIGILWNGIGTWEWDEVVWGHNDLEKDCTPESWSKFLPFGPFWGLYYWHQMRWWHQGQDGFLEFLSVPEMCLYDFNPKSLAWGLIFFWKIPANGLKTELIFTWMMGEDAPGARQVLGC